MNNEDQLYQAMETFITHQDKVKNMFANYRKLFADKYDQRILWNTLLETNNYILHEKTTRVH